MANNAQQLRMKKELGDLQKNKGKDGVGADLVNGSLTHLKGFIKGPADSPYEGGYFVVDIQIPAQYPFQPPKMRFDTKVWHPNISSANGAICLDILKDEWSPALTIRTTLLSLQVLLSCPNPDSPQDAQVADQFKSNYKGWEQTAKYWTLTYATPKKEDDEDAKVAKLAEMGFTKDQCRKALQMCKGDENGALMQLLAGNV